MKLFGCFLSLAIISLGCATLAQQQKKIVELAAVEALDFGKTTRAEIRTRFGNPTRVFPFSKNEEVWIYDENESSKGVQRASFLLDQEKGVVLTATWLPGEKDASSSVENALKHFKNASFQVKELGWIARHEYSNEAIYSDSSLGVSMRVNQASHSVIAISFGGNEALPLAKRQ